MVPPGINSTANLSNQCAAVKGCDAEPVVAFTAPLLPGTFCSSQSIVSCVSELSSIY